MTAFARTLGRILADRGIEYAFGVVGGGNILTVAGLTGSGIRYISARHEGGAMAMADAYHRVSGRVAVCTTSHGAGLTNTATALAEAAKHGSGVLVICGDAPTSGLRRHDVDQSASAGLLGARVLRVDDPATAGQVVAAAVDLARAESRPVVLSVPGDMVTADVAVQVPAGTGVLSHATAEPPELGAVLAAVAGARRPLLLAGLGAWRSGATKALIDLGERLGALYATTAMASGMFTGNRWSLAVFGGFAAPRAAALMADADLVIAFGAGLDPFTLHHGKLLHADATLVQIDVRPSRHVERIDLAVTADASCAASALLDAINARQLPRSGWRDAIVGLDEGAGWDHEPYRDAEEPDRIDPRTLTHALGELLPSERTIVLDGGQFIEWPFRYWTAADPAGLAFMGAAYQTIGLGFAGAVGAAVGRPDRLTVAALGDGGALMGLPELETLIRTGLSALVVVYDDAAFGFEVHMYGPQGADLRTASFTDTDFAGIARAMGAMALTVRSTKDLWIVRSWSAQGRPGTLLLDCKVARGVVAGFLTDLIADNERSRAA